VLAAPWALVVHRLVTPASPPIGSQIGHTSLPLLVHRLVTPASPYWFTGWSHQPPPIGSQTGHTSLPLLVHRLVTPVSPYWFTGWSHQPPPIGSQVGHTSLPLLVYRLVTPASPYWFRGWSQSDQAFVTKDFTGTQFSTLCLTVSGIFQCLKGGNDFMALGLSPPDYILLESCVD
jgi:hypothetical protein